MSTDTNIADTTVDRIFFTGFMGCGKTTWGRKLATHLGYEFIDLDHLLEEKAGMRVSEYFATHGEDAFRRLESSLLKETPYPEKVVVSTGGGLPCFFDNMAWMNSHGKTAYIRLSPITLAQRLENSKTVRPVLQGRKGDELVEFIKHKLAEREGFYLQSQYVIEGISLSVEGLEETLVK